MTLRMRRIKLFAGCVFAIVLAIPLLPGLGFLVIAEILVVLEREFPWVGRLLNRLQAMTLRHERQRRERRGADLLLHARVDSRRLVQR